MADIPFFPFPFHPEEEDEKSLQTFKWKTDGQDYTMYAIVLNGTNVQILVRGDNSQDHEGRPKCKPCQFSLQSVPTYALNQPREDVGPGDA
jgi:hypothetical protein